MTNWVYVDVLFRSVGSDVFLKRYRKTSIATLCNANVFPKKKIGYMYMCDGVNNSVDRLSSVATRSESCICIYRTFV